MEDSIKMKKRASSLRWRILKNAFLHHNTQGQSESSIKLISRKATRGFNLIPYRLLENTPDENSGLSQKSNLSECSPRDVCVCYTIPIAGVPELHLFQRVDSCTNLDDFEISNRYNIDNTGLVCSWPSEDILAYYCLSHADIFRSKRVIELGSGYGLAGLVIAAFTEASEVVISDGNPQVVDYIQRNINTNSSAFGDKLVKSTTLHWDQRETSDYSNSFDLIVASDCTFFKDFHKGLAETIKFLLKKDMRAQALLFSPKRGDSLEKFLLQITTSGLHYIMTEVYDTEIWNRHQQFISGTGAWPNYEKDHCYPILVTVTL